MTVDMTNTEAISKVENILDLFSGDDVFDSNEILKNVIDNIFPVDRSLKSNEYCFYRVNKVSFDEDYPRREAFENVLMSIDNEAFNFVYMLTGTKKGIDLCIGAVKNANSNEAILGTKMSAVRYGENIAEAFKGNFNGSELELLKGERLKDMVINMPTLYKHAGLVIGVPSVDDKGNENDDFQGIDRLINSLLGQEWRITIVCEPVSKREVKELRDSVYELYNRLSVWAKRNIQNTVNSGSGVNYSENSSETRSKNLGTSDAYAQGSSTGRNVGSSNNQDTSSKSSTSTLTTNKGSSVSHANGKTASVSRNKGTSQAVTVEWANKCVQEMMKYIDEELLERIKNGVSKTMFKTSVFYMAKEPVVAKRLKVGLMSLFQGNNPSYSSLRDICIDLGNVQNYKIIRNCQNNYILVGNGFRDKLTLLGIPYDENVMGLNTYLTTKEISLLTGLPQKEVPGLVLKEAVDFGLNEKATVHDDAIKLGMLVQKGRILEEMPFHLDKKSLSKHTFIAGVTGSGKTTTCHRLLAESGVPFMVIEPAKTEYRTLINNNYFNEDLIVFTVGNEKVAPIRINPFELVKDELITSHIDMLKATFTSAFPMEASMPQLLEEAMYSCYEALGWDIATNTNLYYDDPFRLDVDSFPQISDLLKAMEKVVEDKGFDERLKRDYIGSLKSRLSNLTVGSKGMMLNCSHSVDFDYLASHNVILELEDIKSPEEKALIMGFILSRMAAIIKNKHKSNANYKHITLVEEAHRLLSKVEYGDSGAKKVAVETFTDLLAEVRKYGEGLIIVDQIPNKLASEVLKNTNTKIIHRILAKDDKEAVGDTMLMEDKQKAYLSSLEPGYAIVFTENTDNPVNIYINQVSDTNEAEVEEKIVTERFLKKKSALGGSYNAIEINSSLKSFNKLADLFAGSVGKLKEKWVDILSAVDESREIIAKTAVKAHMKDDAIIELMIARRDFLNGNRYNYCRQSLEIYQERQRLLKVMYCALYKGEFDVEKISSFTENNLLYLRRGLHIVS